MKKATSAADISRLREIKSRLYGLYGPDSGNYGRPWRYNPAHEMFMGTTNALEMYTRSLNLGRNNEVWVPSYDDHGNITGRKLTEDSLRNKKEITALGEFLQNCREDMDWLIRKIDIEKE